MKKTYEVEGEFVGDLTLLVYAENIEEAFDEFYEYVEREYGASPVQTSVRVRIVEDEE